MNKFNLVVISGMLAVALTACGNKGGDKTALAGNDVKMLDFVTTQDGTPLVIKPELFDTSQAKQFASTGKNPYIGNTDAETKGKKLFQAYSCTQCHGGDAQGQTGPSLHGPDFHYPKNATNKGMFETIWHGTNNGMGAKGKGLMDPTDASNGLSPDEVLQVIAWIRTHGKITGNE